MAESVERFDTATAVWREWQDAPWGRLRYLLAEVNLARHLRQDGTSLRVLDLAGGDGGAAVRLAGRGHRVTVVDFAPGMLTTAAERVAAIGLGDLVTCVRADVTDLPSALSEGEFDVVLCHNLLSYVADLGGVLATAASSGAHAGLAEPDHYG